MVKIIIGLLAVATISFGGVITTEFSPSQGDLYDLPHETAYSWGIDYNLAQGEHVTSATLEISNVYNWEDNIWNALFIDLLDSPDKIGVKEYADFDHLSYGLDNSQWEEMVDHDYFVEKGYTLENIERLNWNNGLFGKDGESISDSKINLVSIDFNETQINALNSYLGNDGKFGFGVDADCHFYNDGFKFTMTTETPENVPESTILSLLGCGLLRLVFVRRKK